MLTLTIDTSFGFSIGLVKSNTTPTLDTIDELEVIDFIHNPSPFEHVEKLVPTISKILDSNKLKVENLDKVSVNIGPAPFTGLRVGLSIAKAFSLYNNIIISGVSCLDVEEILTPGFTPVSRAKRNTIYYKFKDNYNIATIEEFKEISKEFGIKKIVGNIQDYKGELSDFEIKESKLATKESSEIYACIEGVASLNPLYLREANVQK